MKGKHRSSDHHIRTHAVSRLISIGLLGCVVMTGGCCLPQAIRATCQPYENLKEQELLKIRARRQARQDWGKQYEQCYGSHTRASDIREGFEAAYVETAIGLKGCPPPVPTRRLISLETITHTYPAAGPWYQGYSIGHASAVSRGVDRWRLAPIDPALAAAYASRHCAYASHQHGRTGIVRPSSPETETESIPGLEAPEPIPLPPAGPEESATLEDIELEAG